VCCGKLDALVRALRDESVHVERSAKDADREMSEMRRVVVELNPADDAVVFQILRDLGFADAEMFGEFGFQATAGFECRTTTAALRLGTLPAAASGEIAEADTKSLARFDVVRSNLVGIRKKKHSGTGGRAIYIVHFVERAGDEAAQHGIKLGHARCERRIAGAAVCGAFGRKHRRSGFGLARARRVIVFGGVSRRTAVTSLGAEIRRIVTWDVRRWCRVLASGLRAILCESLRGEGGSLRASRFATSAAATAASSAAFLLAGL
jgi:hypothetical protein